MIFVKNSRGGREVNIINTLSKINLSKIGCEGRGVNLNLDNVLKYTVFFRVPLKDIFGLEMFAIMIIWLSLRPWQCLTYAVKYTTFMFFLCSWGTPSNTSEITQLWISKNILESLGWCDTQYVCWQILLPQTSFLLVKYVTQCQSSLHSGHCEALNTFQLNYLRDFRKYAVFFCAVR